MFEMRVRDAAVQLVDLMYKLRANQLGESDMFNPRDTSVAIYMAFDVSLNYWKEGQEGYDRASVHFLFYRPYGNYTTVFFAEHDNPFARLEDVKQKLEFVASHDSCWRDDGIDRPLSQVFFKMVDRVQKIVGDIAPKNMNQHVWHHELPRWVSVEVTKDPTDKHGHKKLVKFK